MIQTTIVFDLDGTLVHSAPDLAYAANTCLAEYEATPLSVNDVAKMIGNGMPMTLRRALLASNITLSEAAFAGCLERFFDIYADNLMRETALYPGVMDLLQNLNVQGFRLAMCTNKKQDFAENLAQGLGLSGHFHAIIGSVDGRARKPSPEPLLLALDLSEGQRGRAVMVGDSRADAECAEAAGVPCVLVDYGYTTTPVSELPAAAVISRISELPAILTQLGLAQKL